MAGKSKENASRGSTKGQSGKPGSDQGRAAWRGYLNASIAPEDRSEFESYAEDVDRWSTDYMVALADGYKLSSYYDARNNAYVAGFFDTDTGRPTGGYSLNQRSTDPFRALQKLLYVHHVVLGQDWEQLLDNRNTSEVW